MAINEQPVSRSICDIVIGDKCSPAIFVIVDRSGWQGSSPEAGLSVAKNVDCHVVPPRNDNLTCSSEAVD
ncbi:hypothetical protein JYU04_02820 [Dehalococcoides mccartyi]|nr:hypothetical protein [Dehalococcoides mccartyi]